MSTIETCRDCGRLFEFLPRGICGECLDAREEQFRVVRAWVRTNNARSMDEVAEATETSVSLISEWVSQGRLEFAVATDDVDVAEQQRQQDLRDRLRGDLVRSIETNDTPAAQAHRGMHGRRHGS